LIPITDITHAIVKHLLSQSKFKNQKSKIELGPINDLLPQSDFAITVSGTAALHVAAYGIPLVVVYRGNPLLWHLIGRWIVKTRTYSLVNILSGAPAHIVPEFIPWHGSATLVANQV